MNIYFAHAMSTYGTIKEKKAIQTIQKRWVKGIVLNPGDPAWEPHVRFLYPMCGMGMFNLIAQRADMIIAMPFQDGKFGAGVYSELAAANQMSIPMFLIDPKDFDISSLNFMDAQPLSVAETRARLKLGLQ